VRYFSKTPSPPLGDFVERFWHFSDAPAHSRERIVPSGAVELVINLQETTCRRDRRGDWPGMLHRCRCG